LSRRTHHSWLSGQLSFWDAIANEYRYLYGDQWSQYEDKEIGGLIASVLRLGDSVLDLGCGQGLGARLIANARTPIDNYVGLDISCNMLRLADVRGCSPAALIQADMQSIPLASRSVSSVISLFGSASYTEAPEKTVAEIARVLVPGGSTIVMFLSRWSLRRLLRFRLSRTAAYGTHGIRSNDRAMAQVRFFSKTALLRIFDQHGFTVTKVYGQSLFRSNLDSVLLWRTSRFLGRVFPNLGHALIIVGFRINTPDADGSGEDSPARLTQ
jgi:ubiquinone/menaquinone biosynthesis C-methylase UbiE